VAGQPIFCVHAIGANVFCYRELAVQLDPQFSVHGIQSRENAGLAASARSAGDRALDITRQSGASTPS